MDGSYSRLIRRVPMISPYFWPSRLYSLASIPFLFTPHSTIILPSSCRVANTREDRHQGHLFRPTPCFTGGRPYEVPDIPSVTISTVCILVDNAMCVLLLFTRLESRIHSWIWLYSIRPKDRHQDNWTNIQDMKHVQWYKVARAYDYG